MSTEKSDPTSSPSPKRAKKISSPSDTSDDSDSSQLTTKKYFRMKKRTRNVPIQTEKGMTEWQQNLNTVLERDIYLLENDMFMDCAFTVGEGADTQEIKCHSVFLAKTSPVFAAMLYGDMFNKDENICLPDITPKAFKAILKYVYTGQIELRNYALVCEILYTAKKYLFPTSLLNQLRGYLWRNIYPKNVWFTIQFAMTNDEQHLLKTAWKVVSLNTNYCLTLRSLRDIPMKALITLVRHKTLACSEVDLFNACVRWATSEAERQNILIVEPKHLREILEPVIPYIRFLNMEFGEFTDGPVKSGIIDEKEQLSIYVNKSTSDHLELPSYISKNKECREKSIQDEIFYVEASQFKHYTNFPNDTNSVVTYADITLKKDRVLHSVMIPTQFNGDKDPQNSNYDEDLSLFLINKEDSKIILHHRLTKNVPYNAITTIVLKKKFDETTEVKLHVRFHKSGYYFIKSRQITGKKESIPSDDINNMLCVRYYADHFKFFWDLICLNPKPIPPPPPPPPPPPQVILPHDMEEDGEELEEEEEVDDDVEEQEEEEESEEYEEEEEEDENSDG